MVRKIFSAFLLVMVVAAQVLAAQKSDKVIVTGQGLNKDAAVSDALRQAIQQVAGVYIMSEEQGRDYVQVKDEIFAQTEGYVDKFEPVGDPVEEDGIWKARVAVWVRTGTVRNALIARKILQFKKHRPRVMVVLPEYHIQLRVPDPAAETEIIRRLTENDFMVVDQDRSTALKDNEKLMQQIVSEKDPRKLVSLIKPGDAEIIITGEAFSETANRQNNEYGTRWVCGARVEIKAVEVDTGRVLYADGAQATSWDAAEGLAGKRALSTVASLLCEGGKEKKGFIDALLEKLKESVDYIQVGVKGVENESDLKVVEDALRDLPGHRGLHRYKYEPPTALFNLETSLPAQDLTEEIARQFRCRVDVWGKSVALIRLPTRHR